MRQKSNWLFAQIALAAMAILALTIGLFYKIYTFAFGIIGEAALHKVQAACGCQPAGATTNNTVFIGFAFLVGAALGIVLLIAFFKLVFSIIKTRKFIRAQQPHIVAHSKKLSQIAGSIGASRAILEINTDRPLIFCYGIRNERIYISSAVVEALSFAQLRAVLLHETHHVLVKEPARLLLIKFISAFNFIPGIKNLTKKYLSFSEIAADELATDNFTEKNHLAAAMASMLEMEQQHIIQKELALSFFSQITEERILTLSDRAYQPTFKTEAIKALASIALAAILLFFFGAKISTQQAKAQELYTASGCTGSIQIEKCQNSWTKCVNKMYHEQKINCATPNRYFK